jgi:mRNA interferase RelE/StbE
MSYQIAILRRAVKELAHLPEKDRRRIEADIETLASNPRPHGVKKLTGRDGYRLRSGHYRIVFEIDDRLRSVTVLHIGHRKDIYR